MSFAAHRIAAARQSQLLVSGIMLHNPGNTDSNTEDHEDQLTMLRVTSQNSVDVMMKLLFPGEDIFITCPVTKLLHGSEKENEDSVGQSSNKFDDPTNPPMGHIQVITPTKDVVNSITGTLAMTSYRVLFSGQLKDKLVVDQVPMAMISKITKVGGKSSIKEQGYRLEIVSKDGKLLRFTMPRGGGIRRAVYKRLKARTNDYCKTYNTQTIASLGGVDPGWDIYNIEDANRRMGVGAEWRIADTNATYALCPTYPASVTVPANASDALLQAVAGYRTKRRLPVLSYRHWRSNATITRASQPKPGMSRSRCPDDEQFIKYIRLASFSSDAANSLFNENDVNNSATMNTGPQLYIIDARPYANAIGNVVKGAGWELVTNYEACKIEFCGVANIHVMRDSLHKLRDACYESDVGWYKSLEQSGWYNHISGLLSGAIRVARLVDAGIPSLVHCSDGWDRTAQLVCLAMIMLDPYYRTWEGFATLIEREWAQMGHQFSLRCGHEEGKEDQRSPVFFQFLEALYQFMSQFPIAFEYNSKLLSFLHHHSHACLFGTFLTNCERTRLDIKTKTRSIWSYVSANVNEFRNSAHQPADQVLIPECSVKVMHLWRDEFLTSINYV